jgi:probable HAF family extracellular repeat protein
MFRSFRKTHLQVQVLEDRCTPSYGVVDLGAFTAYGLNDVGQVVGYDGGAVLWQNGALIHLAAGSNSDAYAVNDAGQVAGYGTFGGSTYTHAFRWDATHGITDLGTLSNRPYSAANDINASGQVVGVSKQMNMISSSDITGGMAFLWDSANGMRDLGISSLWTSIQNSSTATAINTGGQIVGYSQESEDGSPAIATADTAFFRDSSGTAKLLPSLPGWMYSKALDINDQGQVVGSSGDYQLLPHSITYRPQQAVLWQNGVATGLGVPAGYLRDEARAINNAGQVVVLAFSSTSSATAVGEPFLWQNDVWTDLGVHFATALDINNYGQIMVAGSGNSYLLNPPPTVAAVQVNDGSAQRSEVKSISVTFSGPVTFTGGNAAAAAAFQLQHLTDVVNVALASAVSTDAQGRTVVTLSFSGSETDAVSAQNGGMASLADGRYSLTVISTMVSAGGEALNGGGPNGNYVSPTDTYQGNGLHLFRLFADVNGDGVVDASDVGLLKQTFNRTSADPLYLWYLDADNNGSVDATDVGQFKARFNTNVFG